MYPVIQSENISFKPVTNSHKMNSIKSVILLICLSLSISLYAQSKDTLLLKNLAFNFKSPNFTTIDKTFGIKNLGFQKSVTPLTLDRAVKVSHFGRKKVSIANHVLKIDSIEV